MGKIKVIKEIEKSIELAIFISLDENDVIGKLLEDKKLSKEQRLEAIKAYLNEDGYEVEKTPEELAVEVYKEIQSTYKTQDEYDRGWDKGYIRGMEWMNKTFNLGIDFQEE